MVAGEGGVDLEGLVIEGKGVVVGGERPGLKPLFVQVLVRGAEAPR